MIGGQSMANDIVARAVEQYAKDQFQDGDIISHDWLAWALDLPKPQSVQDFRRCQFVALSRIDDFRDRLLVTHKVALRNVRSEGYRVVPANEQAKYAIDVAAAHIEKGLSKGRKILKYTRMSQLSGNEKRAHNDTAAKMDSLRRMNRVNVDDMMLDYHNRRK